MSHRIVGLDIGSHAVKVIRIESSFRSQEVTGYDELGVRPITPETDDAGEADERVSGAHPAVSGADQAHREAVRVALSELHARGSLEGDVLVVGYPLARCLQARVTLPFEQRRQIEQVLPIQIEEQLPVELDELAIEFQVSSLKPGDIDSPTPLRRIDVIATRRDDLESLLAMLNDWDLDPRIVEVGPASLWTAYDLLTDSAAHPNAMALVDIGHRQTGVCLVEREEIGAMRSLRLGGADLTEALAAALSLPADEAEYRKLSDASLDVSPSAPPAQSPQQQAMREVAMRHAARLSSELRRTFQSYSADTGQVVDKVVLTGGGSLLRGLPHYLVNALGLAVEYLQVPEAATGGPGSTVRAVTALGLAARGLARSNSSRFNLRRGQFGFRGDLEFLKARSRPLLVLGAFLVAAVLFAILTQRSAVEARRDAYREALCDGTEALLSERICSPGQVMQRLAGIQGPTNIVSSVSAYDIFRDVSSELVYLREDYEIPIEIERVTVDIQRDVITIRGNTDSAESVDEIVSQLGTLSCVQGIASESTTQNRATGLFDFVLRAQNSCS